MQRKGCSSSNFVPSLLVTFRRRLAEHTEQTKGQRGNNFDSTADLFRKFDEGNDERLSHDEFTNLLKTLGADVHDDETAELLDRLNPDADGCVSLHTLELATMADLLHLTFPTRRAKLTRLRRREWDLFVANCRNGNLKNLHRQEQVVGNMNDIRTKESLTPLHIAAATGHNHVVSWLLKRGLAVNARDKRGSTALHMAAFHGHLSVCRTLHIEGGGDIFSKTCVGTTVLQAAILGDHVEVLAWLLRRGAARNLARSFALAEKAFKCAEYLSYPTHSNGNTGISAGCEDAISGGKSGTSKVRVHMPRPSTLFLEV